jgi:hypothetical protein
LKEEAMNECSSSLPRSASLYEDGAPLPKYQIFSRRRWAGPFVIFRFDNFGFGWLKTPTFAIEKIDFRKIDMDSIRVHVY